MESKLIKLKNDFNNITNVRNNVENIFDVLHLKIVKLKTYYSEFIENNKNQMFVFGLDSFHFQNRLIDIEYDEMRRMFLAINNRMYCEYFKLYKIIVKYIEDNLKDKKILEIIKINNFPVYKDLEPYKEYKFEIILEIHENILALISSLISILIGKENELAVHRSKKDIGLNIDNFITTFNFNVTMMREEIYMFVTYVEFFHKMHTKYLKRFSNKIQLMYSHINHDIRFDESIEMNKERKQQLINEFPIQDNGELLEELKNSINTDSDNESRNDAKINNDTDSNSGSITPNSREKLGSSASLGDSVQDTPKKDIRTKFREGMFNLIKLKSVKPREKPKLNAEEKPMTNAQVESLFLNIDLSCDSIINEDNIIDNHAVIVDVNECA